MRKLLIISLLVFAAIVCSCGRGVEVSQVVVKPMSNDNTKAIVDSIYAKMSMDDKVAQLHGISPRMIVRDKKLSLELCRKRIPHGVGHLSQFACMDDMTPDELRTFVKDLQNYLINETSMGIPAIFHEEAITGFTFRGATAYPQQIGVAATWDPELMKLKCDQTREAMRSCGGTMALSPMVDIIRSQHFNRGEESYGEDSYLSSVMANAFITGLQGEDLSSGIATCSKHFLGYGGGSENSEKVVYEEIIMPHEVAMRVAGSKGVMTNYGDYKGENCVNSKHLIQGVLRDYLGYDGTVVSDYSSISSRWMWKDRNDSLFLHKRAMAAINAGNDLELSDKDCYRLIPELVKQGKVSEKRLEEAVKLNLTLKARLGLLDKNPTFVKEGEIDLDKPEYRKTAYDLAKKSIVLLKNNGILPLNSDKTPNISLVGPNANSFWAMLGDYTYQGMFSFWHGGRINPEDLKVYNLKEGLESKMGDKFSLQYERGCDWANLNSEGKLDILAGGDPRVNKLVMMIVENNDSTNWDKAVEMSGKKDVIVAAVGENVTLSGEGRVRDGISLPGSQEKFVEDLIATGKPVVVVMFGGRAQVLSDKILNGAAAIMQAWYPGEEGGNAVADLLLGNVNPSGKLSVSYPATQSKESICYNENIEANKKLVAFPFGHGLSYSTFDYSDITAPASVEIGKQDVEMSLKLTNSGKYDGDEVVQLYISPKSESTTHKSIQLKGFKRVSLKAGESKVVSFKFSPKILEYYDGKMWRLEGGEYQLKVGSSSSDIRLSSDIKITGESKPKKNRDIFFSYSSVK